MTLFATARAESIPRHDYGPLAAVTGWIVRRVQTMRWPKSHPRPDRLPDHILKDIGLSRLEFEFGKGGRILDARHPGLFRRY